MEVPDHLTCLLRNLYVDQEIAEMDMNQLTSSKLGKEYDKAVYRHSAYSFNFSAEKMMWNAGLDESQARIKIGLEKY